MQYGWLSAVKIFYSSSHVIYLEQISSEIGQKKRVQSYQRDSFRDFPICGSNKVSQVASVFPGKDQPDHIIGYAFNESVEVNDVGVRKLHQKSGFPKRQLGKL